MRIRLATARLAAALLCVPSTAALSQSSYAGSYDVRVCKGNRACGPADTAAIFAVGVLVVGGDSIGFGTLPSSVWDFFRRYNSVRSPVNACYALKRVQTQTSVDSYAGARFVRWMRFNVESPERDSVRFELYRSPDASHVVKGRWVSGTIKGLGQSFFSPPSSTSSWGMDSVIATRVGPPDEELCAVPAHAECKASGRCSGV